MLNCEKSLKIRNPHLFMEKSSGSTATSLSLSSREILAASKIKSKAVVAFKVNSMFIALKYLQVSNPIQNLLFLYHRVHKQNHFIPFDISQVLSKPNFTTHVLHVKNISITWYISALFYFNINAWWSLKLFTFLQNLYAPGLLG